MATQTTTYAPPTLASGSRVVIVVSAGPPAQPPRGFVDVPDVMGAKQGDALGALQEAGLAAQVYNDYSATAKRGEVIGQLPAAGASAPSGTEAVLLVSSGPAPTPTSIVALTDVVGKTEQEAVSTLQSSGFSPQVVREYSATVPAGTVIAQLPNRQSIAAAAAAGGPNWIVWAAIAAVVVILGIVGFMLFRPSGSVVVPDVVGQTQEEAVKELEDEGLKVKVTVDTKASDADPGTVVRQDPPAGSEADVGDEEEIVVAPSPELVTVPDVRRQNQADATKTLQDAGLGVSVTRQPSTSVDKGLVMDQSPAAGQKVAAGTTVGIVISDGPKVENVDVPDVVGMTRSDAEKALADAGLKVAIAENSSKDVAKDVVITQLPKAGDSVAPGTSVGIVVSTGPPAAEQVDVPDVVGLTLAEAQQVISDAGLQAIPVSATDTGKPANEVVAQEPKGGTKADKGADVVLFYSAGP